METASWSDDKGARIRVDHLKDEMVKVTVKRKGEEAKSIKIPSAQLLYLVQVGRGG